LLVAGKLVHVCVSSETWKKIELPEWVRTGMRRFAEADAEQVADPA
jgi:acyl-CoA thioesterase FadM